MADGGSVVGVDKRDFAMTETDSHRVTLGTFVATYDRGLYKGLGNESALTVTVSRPSCGNSVVVSAPTGCQFTLRPEEKEAAAFWQYTQSG